ncbi:MAG: transglutaminase domain-containing protein [bacterium]
MNHLSDFFLSLSTLAVLITILLSSAPVCSAGNLSYYRINPLYRHLYNDRIPFRNRLHVYGTPVECSSFEALRTTLHDKFTHRVLQFSIHLVYSFTFEEVGDILNQAFADVMAEDDYLMYSYRSYRYAVSGYDGDVDIDYDMEYLTTYAQEEQVSLRVAEILAEIITESMSDEVREKAIHDWIVANVDYDMTYTEYSAYAALFLGTTVCQGYSLLTYKMLHETNIGVRIVEGLGGDEPHAWNLVNLCGTWYHLDVTWDDPGHYNPNAIYYTYFNKSSSEMSNDHTFDEQDYPEALISYEEGVCEGVPPSSNNEESNDEPAVAEDDSTSSGCFIMVVTMPVF